MNRHYSGGWIVYFNGIEVPASSVHISARIGDIPQATIEMPPDATVRRIGAEDRVRATVFHLDPVDKDFRLLFEGEIVSYEYTTSAQGRSLRYIAVDFIAVLTQLFPKFITGLRSLMSNIVDTSQNSLGVVMNPLLVAYSMFNQGLSSGEPIRRPHDLVYNVFMLLLGEGITESARSVISTHWFTRWLERTRLLDRIIPSVPLSEDVEENEAGGFPILEAAQARSVLETLAREGAGIASNSSFYMMIQTLFQRVYYEVAPVLGPPCVAVDTETLDPVGAPEDFGLQGVPGANPEVLESFGQELQSWHRLATPVRLGLVQHVTQPKNYFGIPPRCNVFWPSTVENHSFSENYATQPTRTYIGIPELVKTVAADNPSSLNDLLDFVTTVAYPEQAQEVLRAPSSSQEEGSSQNFLVYPEEFFKGPVYNQMQAPSWIAMINEDSGKYLTPEEDFRGEDRIKGRDRIHRIYAAMEHYRQRLSMRNGSVRMVFNPYVLLGHSCAVIDNEEANHHVFGYVVGVSHSLTLDSMSTTVSYTYGQSLEEFMETYLVQMHSYPEIYLHSDAVGVGVDGRLLASQYDFAPFHPVKYMRDKFQKLEEANKHFSRLYWRSEQDEVMFDWMNVFGVRPDVEGTHYRGDPERLTFPLEGSNAIAREHEGYIPHYAILPEYQEHVRDADVALRYNHRPICSVDEYILFHGKFGVREGLRHPSNPREGKAAPYYVKILDFIQGPGEEMDEKADGGRCGVLEADTRRDWESRLLRFRDKVYNADHPHLA